MAPELRARKPVSKSAPKEKATTTKRKAMDESASPATKKSKTEKAKSEPMKKDPKLSKKDKTADGDEHPFSDDDEDEAEILGLAGVAESDDEETKEDSKLAFLEGQDVGKVPKVSNAVKQSIKSKGDKEDTGVLYIGRLPHGFYERELKSYFEQFGPVINLRVSRNKKTAASKHYAFIEFAEESTARIVEKTMDGYLLFQHIIRCRMVPKARIHENLWKGANKRFKAVPTNKLQGNKLKKPLTESQWEAKAKKVSEKRAKKAEKLKELGYEFSAPELKVAVHDSEEVAALEGGEEDTPKAIEALPVVKDEKIEEAKPVKDDDAELSGEKPVVKKLKKTSKQDATKTGMKKTRATKSKKARM